MKSRTLFGLILVLIAGITAGYLLTSQRSAGVPSATPIADDMIVVDSPLPGAVISSPLTVTGKARGSWYFEASFPVILVDSRGTVLAQVPAQAKGDWMTTDFVPFEATLTFDASGAASGPGTLIFRKDNPSGEPRYDDSRQMTVYFK